MSKKRTIDDRKQLLLRYRIDDKERVSFIDPCCDEIPAELFGEIMKAFSHIQEKWNNSISKNELTYFFETMNKTIMSGEIIVEKYSSVELKNDIKAVLPSSHDIKTVFFATGKNILFLRIYPLYYQLSKLGYMQDITINKLGYLLRNHPSFIGHVDSKYFRYSELETDKRICSSCMALDYDLFLAAFKKNKE